MAALTLQSQPFPEVSLLSVTHLPSQRLTRHALAILQLLTTEGDGVAGEDRRAQERKLLVDQIMKLVLGILHLLNEGLVSPEHSAPFSEEDWLCMEREQRQLYSDLMADNDQTLGTLGSLTVKSEEVAAADLEEETAEMSADPLTTPTGDLSSYSDPQTDPPKAELSEPTALTYQNPFLDTLKSSGLPTFPGASNYSDSSIGSYMGHSTLTAFPRTFPQTSSTTAEAASMMGNGMADPYLGNSSDDFPVENLPIQIKREGSSSSSGHQQQPECMYDTERSDNVRRRPSLQLTCRKSGPAPGTSSTSRSPEYPAPKPSTLLKSALKLSQRKRFQCEQCEKTFTYRAHLIMHRRVHTRERPYVCQCGKTFSQSSHLFRHQRSLRVENKASVTIKQEASPPCLQPSEGSEEMNNNFSMVHTQHARQISWKRCREAAKTTNMSGADLGQVPNPLLIAAGSSEIPNAGDLCTAYLPPAAEKLSDRKRFECPQCQKSFNGRAHLIVHQRVHTRERPYICECGKTFTQSSSLFRHQRSHTGEKNHVCTVCGKAFTRRTYLLNHQRNHKEPI